MRELLKKSLKKIWFQINEPVILVILLSLIFYSVMSMIDHQRNYFGILFFLVDWFLGSVEEFLEIIFKNLGFWVSLILFIILISYIYKKIKHKSTTLLIVVLFLYSLIYWSHKQDDLYLSCEGTMNFQTMSNGIETSSSSKNGEMKFSFIDFPERYSWSREEFFPLPVKQVFLFGKYSFPNICQEFNNSVINCKNTIPDKRLRNKYPNEITEYQTSVDRNTGQIQDSRIKLFVDDKGNKISNRTSFNGVCLKITKNSDNKF